MKARKQLTAREILALLREHEDELRSYSVKKIGLFGSYARGRQRTRSDIDFIVEFEQPTFSNFMELSSYLEKLLGRRVDILTARGVAGIRVKEVAESIKRSVVYV